VGLRRLLQPRRHVDRVAEHRGFVAGILADDPAEHLAARQADADAHRRIVVALVVPAGDDLDEVAAAAQLDGGAALIQLVPDQRDQGVEFGALAVVAPEVVVQPRDLAADLRASLAERAQERLVPRQQVAALPGLCVLDRQQHAAEQAVHHHGVPNGLAAALLIGEGADRDAEQRQDHRAAHDHAIDGPGACGRPLDDVQGGGRCTHGGSRSAPMVRREACGLPLEHRSVALFQGSPNRRWLFDGLVKERRCCSIGSAFSGPTRALEPPGLCDRTRFDAERPKLTSARSG